MGELTVLERLLNFALDYAAKDVYCTYSDIATTEEEVQKLGMYAINEFLADYFEFNNGDVDGITFEEVESDYNYDLSQGCEVFKAFMERQPERIKIKHGIQVMVTEHVYYNINDLFNQFKNNAIEEAYENQSVMTEEEVAEFDSLFENTRNEIDEFMKKGREETDALYEKYQQMVHYLAIEEHPIIKINYISKYEEEDYSGFTD